MMMIEAVVIAAAAAAGFMQRPQFGRAPSGARRARISRSPNFQHGSFRNQHDTPILADGKSTLGAMREFLLEKRERQAPLETLPVVKTDLRSLDPARDVLVWFGHSSYFLQIDGLRVLVDPVFSSSASPLPFLIRAYPGTTLYSVDDMPPIDLLVITHDHWDHLDYATITRLKSRVKHVVCGLGVGAHFERWGFDERIVDELDWGERASLSGGSKIHAVPSRHFSGRTLNRNKSLWCSYVLETPTMKLFLGGDGGYDTHFADIGRTFGPFDLAVLENGQYNWKWRYIHMLPEHALEAAQDLRAKRVVPVHSSKFTLAMHPWNEPLEIFSDLCAGAGIPLATPMIGEPVDLRDTSQHFSRWWTLIR